MIRGMSRHRFPSRLRSCLAIVLAFSLAAIASLAMGDTAFASAKSRAAQQALQAQQALDDDRIQRNVETALYKQPALLAAQFTALKPAEPRQVNMYFVGVGGDGTQEVFRREIEYVQQDFDQRMGTRGRSIVLVNSRSSADRLPMATVTSIRQSLQAVAAKMDKSRDILFLYLSSHGSRDHVLSLEQEGMFLRGLSAVELAGMLKETGIRWKVVVVGACYAGGFIKPLQDEHTMVIAAARADRSSFGCQDENDFTYFGRAFFKEALPQASSFGDAFKVAQERVRQRETQLFGRKRAKASAFSEPQMHEPPEVRQYLQAWWVRNEAGAAARP